MREKIAAITGTIGAFQLLAQGELPAGTVSTADLRTAITSTPTKAQQVANGSENSEAQVGETIADWMVSTGIELKSRRDGFEVNGQPFIDPEGTMYSYAYDVTNGLITYAVKTARGIIIKALNSKNIGQSIVIGTGTLSQSGWQVQTTSGKQLAGDTLTVLSDGFMIGRAASAFRYQSGIGVKSIAIPDGYVLAPLQRGNVGATGHILLEREAATGGQDPVNQMISSFAAIGSIIGVNKKNDYALMSIDTGKLHTFNIPANGRYLTLMADCRRKNWLVSICQKAQSIESTYGPDGSKNNSHYYWLVNWVETTSGPIALTLEDGLANIYITDLSNDKKVVAFNRSFGIADWNVAQSREGRVSIKAKLAFEWQEVPDALALLSAAK